MLGLNEKHHCSRRTKDFHLNTDHFTYTQQVTHVFCTEPIALFRSSSFFCVKLTQAHYPKCINSNYSQLLEKQRNSKYFMLSAHQGICCEWR